MSFTAAAVSRRLPAGPSVIAALSVVVVLLAGGVQARSGTINPEQNSACSAIIAVYGSSLDASSFLEACSEPAFQNAYATWGGSNFSLGGQNGGSTTYDYYAFDWAAQCNNLSVAPPSQTCSFQEFWTVNLSTGVLSGPTVAEHVAACACSARPSPGSSTVPQTLTMTAFPIEFLAMILAAGTLLLVLLLRRRARPRSPPPTR